MSAPVDHRTLYRLPWNLADNAITWLEPTTKCNLYCEGCYRENDPQGHRPLEDVIRELETVRTLRRTDGISIAGGEPLIYPHIVELVRYVAAQGWKPIINSNGHALTPALVRDLAKAGLVGFTMHVDSHQMRPGWKGKSEAELCELRLNLAEMIREHGGGKVACAFNATIYRDTLDDVPMLTRWAQEHMDTVQTMVFILFRSAKAQAGFDCFAGGKPVDVHDLVYQLDHMEQHKDIVAQEVVDKIREIDPAFEPCAYLNGTEDPRSMKWLLTLKVGYPDRILGYLDPKFAEILQSVHHLLFDTYLAYARPTLTNTGQAMLPLALVNRSVRDIFWKWLREPSRWTECLYVQSVMIIQPCDVYEDGRQNMCDGCPDAILHKGRMVWSCRVDELQKYGTFITCAPRGGCCGASGVAPGGSPVGAGRAAASGAQGATAAGTASGTTAEAATTGRDATTPGPEAADETAATPASSEGDAKADLPARKSPDAVAVREEAQAPAVKQAAAVPAVRPPASAPAVKQVAPAPAVRGDAPAPAVKADAPTDPGAPKARGGQKQAASSAKPAAKTAVKGARTKKK